MTRTQSAAREIASSREVSDLERFFDQSIDMLCIAGFDGFFQRLNPAWERTLGWTEEELTTRPWLEFVHPDDRASAMAEAEAQLGNGGDVISFEHRFLARDGSYHWLRWNSRAAPELRQVHAVARDVSEEHRRARALVELNATLEQQVRDRTAALEQRAAELARINGELEAFTYSVSHDLKEPLRSVQAYSQFILEDCESMLDERGKEYLQKLDAATRRMKHLIEDLLALSRVGRGAEVAPTDVNAVLASVTESLRGRIEARDADVSIEEGLPAVLADAVRLDQIFANLVSNAIKFKKDGRPVVRVGLRQLDDAQATFFVQDNGIGIAPEFAGKIFAIFQRLHARDEFEGTGAGLAIAKRAAETLGGSIMVESDGASGSTFLVTLPRARELAVEAPAAA